MFNLKFFRALRRLGLALAILLIPATMPALASGQNVDTVDTVSVAAAPSCTLSVLQPYKVGSGSSATIRSVATVTCNQAMYEIAVGLNVYAPGGSSGANATLWCNNCSTKQVGVLTKCYAGNWRAEADAYYRVNSSSAMIGLPRKPGAKSFSTC